MRWSRTFIPTLRNDPAGVARLGLRRLIRGGFLRRLDGGEDVFLPLLMRVAHRIRHRLVAALTTAGACEFALTEKPTKRTDGLPTGENNEIRREKTIAEFLNRELRSYRQLPLSFFRFRHWCDDQSSGIAGPLVLSEHEGLELYYIASDQGSLHELRLSMEQVVLDFLGASGVSAVGSWADQDNREQIVLANSPHTDRVIFSCVSCGYCAVMETAVGRPESVDSGAAPQRPTRVKTPGAKTVEEVTAILEVPAHKLVKTLLYKTPQGVIGALVRGDRTLNEAKLRRVLQVDQLGLLDAEGVRAVSGATVGFSGPLGLEQVRLIADYEIPLLRNFVVGGNEDDVHVINVNPDDFPIAKTADIRTAVDGDGCPNCKDGFLQRQTGFVVGRTPRGSSRSASSSGIFLDDETGGEREALWGKSYLDLTAVLLAVVESCGDERGLIWPASVAPYSVHLMAVNPEDKTQLAAVEMLESGFVSLGVEILYDDRTLRVGARFKDADLVGIPLRVIIGPKRLSEGRVEVSHRGTGGIEVIDIDKVTKFVAGRVRQGG